MTVSRRAVALAVLAAAAAGPAAAQENVEAFYKGKTITMIIGTSPGGGYDTYGRLVGRHIGRHIPGTPTIVATNLSGAGSNVAAANVYAVAPKDGTVIGAIFAGAIVEPLLGDGSRLKHDPARLQYLGSANKEVFVCAARLDAPVQKFEDSLAKEMVIGASADGGPTADFPNMLNAFIGSKFKVVRGYPGTREITLAMEKNEVQGACGLAWSTLSVQYPRLMSEGPFRILLQEDMAGHPVLNAAGVPATGPLAKKPEDKAALDLFYAQNLFGRPFVLAPEVPKDRVAALRKAFMAAMADPELLAEAKKLNIDIIPASGEEVQAEVARLFATPKETVDRVRKALGR
jgi:tripartite-type tricarboxylate transporter receptor subunit TctC